MKQKPDKQNLVELLEIICTKYTTEHIVFCDSGDINTQSYTDYSKVVDDLLQVCNIQMKPIKQKNECNK